MSSRAPHTTAIIRGRARVSDIPSRVPDVHPSALVGSAWKKEIGGRSDGTAGWRPEGREPVSEQQIAEARVKKTLDDASLNAQVAVTVRTPPTSARVRASRSHAFFSPACARRPQDWKFLLGILVVLSVGTALLGHQPSGETYAV